MLRDVCPLVDDGFRDEFCRALARAQTRELDDLDDVAAAFVLSTGIVMLKTALAKLARPRCCRSGCASKTLSAALFHGDAAATIACPEHLAELANISVESVVTNVELTPELVEMATAELAAVALRFR